MGLSGPASQSEIARHGCQALCVRIRHQALSEAAHLGLWVTQGLQRNWTDSMGVYAQRQPGLA